MGREFVNIFDQWVHTYDDSVRGKDKEYQDVFKNYEEILSLVADEAEGKVIEFGIGTGNLTQKLLSRGLEVVGIEPNAAMREVTQKKFPDLSIQDGDFMQFDTKEFKPRTLVSTYAFHHLNDDEKAKAAQAYASILPAGGKVIFADTLFESEEAKQARIVLEEARGHKNLVEDLNREYYTTLPVMKKVWEDAGFSVAFNQLNDYVWLIKATK